MDRQICIIVCACVCVCVCVGRKRILLLLLSDWSVDRSPGKKEEMKVVLLH